MTRRLLILLFILSCSALPAQAGELNLTDVTGKQHAPLASSKTKAVALIFITTDCPVANYFQPTIRRIQEQYEKEGVRFFLIHSDPDTTSQSARKHLKEYGITAPVVLDTGQKIAKKHGAKWTPEAVLIAPDGTVTYRGRIDNTYADYGKKRPRPTKEDLKEAIKDLLAGKRPEKPVTAKPVGCPIYFPE